MPEELSIFEAIRRREYAASLVTTFNAYFPFYEEVVLRHLTAAGCQHNVVLMDAGQCGQALARTDLRPRLAGKSYALLPIKCGGAFHPKLVLLAGRQHGLLLVGSHNLTLSGFSFNRELTNCFEYSGNKDRALLPTFHAALNFIKAWAATLPEPLQETVNAMARFAPWLQEPQEPIVDGKESHFFGSEPTGPPLWELVRERVPARVKRIVAVGPFFDQSLMFIKRLGEDFSPKNLVVGIEPEKVIIPADACQIVPQAKFVDASLLHDGSGYLHAKAILFETEQGEELLITGSANPTPPAWLAGPTKRNAEAVILRRAGRKDSLGRALGLSALATQPPLTAPDWEKVSQNKPLSTDEERIACSLLIACKVEDGFEIYGFSNGPMGFSRATLLDADGTNLGDSSAFSFDGEILRLKVHDPAALSFTRLLELQTDGCDLAYAIVHHTADLADAAQTDLQREFKRALASPDSEAPIELLKLIEKVIADDTVDGLFERSASFTSGNNQNDGDSEITSLAADSIRLGQAKTGTRRWRPLATGDLALILSVLIHRLGQGLASPLVGYLIIKRSEEELKEDESEEPDLSVEIDGAALLKTCHRRFRSLFRRMTGQLALAAEGQSNPLRALLHLAAVLGLTQHLTNRVNYTAWVPRGERIVPLDAQWEFFLNACRYLYARDCGVMKAALQEAGDEHCIEASAVRGLLLWLAWDCQLDVRTVLDDDEPDVLWENLYGLEQLMYLTADTSSDEEAVSRTRTALLSSISNRKSEEWLKAQLQWGAHLALLSGDLRNAPTLPREPVRGDLVFLSKVAAPFLTVVLNVEGDKLTLACDVTKKFKSSYVTAVDLSPIQST